MQHKKVTCPICGEDGCGYILNSAEYLCGFCGVFCLSLENSNELKNEKKRISVAYYYHRFLKQAGKVVEVNDDVVKRALAHGLPAPNEQINNLLLYIGEKTKAGVFGDVIVLNNMRTSITIGAQQGSIFEYLVKELITTGYLVRLYGNGVNMTVKGYEQYEALLRSISSSNKVFMAMKYGDKELDDIFDKVFKPAVGKTGFELYRLDEKPEAGIIDNRLRVEIRNAKFLIADLTHSNEGAYWEAGFAEGLGKKVIPTCREGKNLHFNLGHIQTVFWEASNPEKCEQKLKAVIRSTFPDEAKMED